MAVRRVLTKSKFTSAWECSRKLHYLNHPEKYGNNNDEDSFLQMLAHGGFQVGALAQQYYQPGHVIDTLDKDEAIRQTNELLKQENVTIFEAAFHHEDMFLRADIIEKKGRAVKLIEVKAKSFDSKEGFQVWNKVALKKGKYELLAKNEKYVLDLAFQTWVLQHAYPEFSVQSLLLLADTDKVASTSGLNQRFKIEEKDGRSHVLPLAKNLTPSELGNHVLTPVDLTAEMKSVFNEVRFENGPTFRDLLGRLQAIARNDERGEPFYSSQCKKCQFRVVPSDGKSGFDECWSEMGRTSKDIQQDRQFVFDLWNFRVLPKLFEKNIIFQDQLTGDDIPLRDRTDGSSGLSQSARQIIQVEYASKSRKDPFFFDRDGLRAELKDLEYPLHFIDFETAMVAIPFHEGRYPYEQMAFQFSHHVLHKDGRLEERTPFLSATPGEFPNFHFVRALKKSLEGDNGAVMRFAGHENTVLNQIRDQLLLSNEPDLEELVEWIQTLAIARGGSKEWTPTRQFVDMCELTKRFVYLPETNGSNSIKKVLPAVLNVANVDYLRAKFPDWIQVSSGRIVDPYSLLPELDKGADDLYSGDDLADGGGAMMAWCRMQFTEMSKPERDRLRDALLRYCALDTLAMVVLWQWWVQILVGRQ